jgi:hypothetical protein
MLVVDNCTFKNTASIALLNGIGSVTSSMININDGAFDFSVVLEIKE